MKRRGLILLLIGLVAIGAAAATLLHFKERQRLGDPGVKTSLREGSVRLNIFMPTNVPGYTAEIVDSSASEEALPFDTSIMSIRYTEPDLPPVQATTVLMGTDRTSIHRPEFCLPGGGWNIDSSRSGLAVVPMDRPYPADLAVMRVHTTRKAEMNGRKVLLSGIYVYWFVADNAVTAERWQWMSWMADSLIRKGELQRWSYISYFTYCLPGEEELAFDRIKKSMNATVPDFQLAWPKARETSGANP